MSSSCPSTNLLWSLSLPQLCLQCLLSDIFGFKNLWERFRLGLSLIPASVFWFSVELSQLSSTGQRCDWGCKSCFVTWQRRHHCRYAPRQIWRVDGRRTALRAQTAVLCPRGWMSNCSHSHSDDIEEVRCSLNQYIVLQSKIILHIGGLYEVDPTLFPGHVTY